ncbi:esterase/lipase family protein [Luteimonas sp. R10]|uniref:esterase/lipase family protein n=1 Tax=Luteimonas sp. R10 TaxID=3108176 RepID=UPI0030871CB1|nr:alpha/beta hydrolase [Luteimonas sp. R10]
MPSEVRPPCKERILLAACTLAAVLGLAGCGTTREAMSGRVSASRDASEEAASSLEKAIAASRRAGALPGRTALSAWIECAVTAHAAMADADDGQAPAAAALATRCSESFLTQALRFRDAWSEGEQAVEGTGIFLELRNASPNLGATLRIVPANDVSMSRFGGRRHSKPGFGVPVALISPRCTHAPACRLLPPSGVFRSATAWIQAGPGGGPPHLVLAHPVRSGSIRTGARTWVLAMDTSAFYAAGLRDSPIRRLSIWGLLGGQELGRRAGVYLLEDYDPQKRPLVMVHGLGSSPLTWASLSNAVWADPELRNRYQVWQLVYPTNDPVLVARLRVQDHLDAAWAVLDPAGDDAARRGMVLVGHSMGGVVARLLTVDSGDALWRTAFLRPPAELVGDGEDLAALERMFRFRPYPGVRRATFLAAPHRGSPAAESLAGRLAHRLVGRRTPEIRALRRIARQNAAAVPEALRKTYLRGSINSISTLRGSQPVMRVARSLPPAPGIPYHSIAGHLPGTVPPSDGVVPVHSALLEGSASMLVVPSRHNVHEHDLAIAEVVRILHEDREASIRAPGRAHADGPQAARLQPEEGSTPATLRRQL